MHMSAAIQRSPSRSSRKRSFEEMERPGLVQTVGSWVSSLFGRLSAPADAEPTKDIPGEFPRDNNLSESRHTGEPVATGTPLKAPKPMIDRVRPSIIPAEPSHADSLHQESDSLLMEPSFISPPDTDVGQKLSVRLREVFEHKLPPQEYQTHQVARPRSHLFSNLPNRVNTLRRPRIIDGPTSWAELHRRKELQLRQYREWKRTQAPRPAEAVPPPEEAPKALSLTQLEKLRGAQRGERLLGDAYRVEIHGYDLATLLPGKWLNDVVIDAYLADATQGTNCFAFTTFFYTKLSEGGYPAVSRWAKRKKLDVWSLDKLLIPVNGGNTHWMLLVVDHRDHTILFYDSLPGQGARHKAAEAAKLIKMYLTEEAKRLGRPQLADTLDTYTDRLAQGAAEQSNGYDCGMFVCLNAQRIAHGSQLGACQQHMPRFRDWVAWRLLEVATQPNSRL